MIRITLLATSLLLCSIVNATDSGTISNATALYKNPNGSVISQLPENALIEVLRRDGGWYQVKTGDGRTGYVPLRTVQFTEEKEEDSVFGGLWGWLNSSHRSQGDMSTATAGVRGFDETALQASTPNYDAVNRLTGWAVSADSAKAFAKQLPLTARAVRDLDHK